MDNVGGPSPTNTHPQVVGHVSTGLDLAEHTDLARKNPRAVVGHVVVVVAASPKPV